MEKNEQYQRYICLAMDIDGTLKQGGSDTSTKFEIKDNRLLVNSPPLDENVLNLFQRLRNKDLILGGCSGWDLDSMNAYLSRLDFQIAENGSIVQIGDNIHYPENIYGIEVLSMLKTMGDLRNRHQSQFKKITISPYESKRKNSFLVIYAEREFYENFDFFVSQCQQIASEYKYSANFFRKKKNINGEEQFITGVEYAPTLFTKKTGLFYFFEKSGIDPRTAVYFGDGKNDLEIFKSDIGLRVAPEGADKEILSLANIVVPSPPLGIYSLEDKLKGR